LECPGTRIGHPLPIENKLTPCEKAANELPPVDHLLESIAAEPVHTDTDHLENSAQIVLERYEPGVPLCSDSVPSPTEDHNILEIIV